MNTVEQAESPPVEYNDESIAEYLQANPEFFTRNSDLLSELQLPHSTGGAATSLIERQVAILRGRNEQIETKMRDFMQVAQSNDAIANKIRELAILLMGTDERGTVLTILEEQLRTTFSADRPVLVLFDEHTAIDDGPFLHQIDRENTSLGPFKTFLQASQARCGTVRDAQRTFLFGAEDVEVGSVALIPLGDHCEVGFLAIGCRDPDHFHPGKSIDFLTRIGELVAAALMR